MNMASSVSLFLLVLASARSANVPSSTEASLSTVEPVSSSPWQPALDTLTAACGPQSITITITLPTDAQQSDNYIYDRSQELFNGIVYPAGLGTNSSCLREYRDAAGDLQYTLPLTACNTMSRDNDDGTVEFFNNIVVQPHLHLVTGQGRGYRVRCVYNKKLFTHYRRNRVRADRLTSDDNGLDDEDDAFPAATMKIYKGNPQEKQVASNVKIGDPLTLSISIEKQSRYTLLVSQCKVRDGLGVGEQSLIAHDGCSLDGEIMGMFRYTEDRREARVSFPAHRFPYTASVYYSCEVKLCDVSLDLDCEPCSHKRRARRQTDDGSPATVEVVSGLYVDETDPDVDPDVTREKNEDEICISQRNFAIGICIAGVILMLAVIAAIAIILARRRAPKTHSRTGSSLYSGPYTNTGYSHTS